MVNKIFLYLLIGLFLCPSLVIAQQNQINYFGNSEQIQSMKQNQHMFQTRYNFTCEGNCTSIQIENTHNLRMEVRMQKRFMFWNVESLEVYDINENGEIIQAKYNFWSRLLNRNKVKI